MSADDDITSQNQPADASAGDGLALFTDLYQLTMLQAYFEERMTERAVFSLFVRRLPRRRNFLIACGLNAVLDYLENLRFTQQDLAYLDSLEIFSDRFLAWLADFRFTGDVHAVREGTPIFANEPILEVEAPLPEAQVIETFVMNQVQLQTMLASKANRVVTAARGRSVIDFGARRMHGTDAALKRCARILDRRRQRHLQRPCGTSGSAFPWPAHSPTATSKPTATRLPPSSPLPSSTPTPSS